jgi:hypothetical protein
VDLLKQKLSDLEKRFRFSPEMWAFCFVVFLIVTMTGFLLQGNQDRTVLPTIL